MHAALQAQMPTIESNKVLVHSCGRFNSPDDSLMSCVASSITRPFDSEDVSTAQVPRTPHAKSSVTQESSGKSEKDFASVLGGLGGSPTDGNEIDSRTGMPFWVQVLS